MAAEATGVTADVTADAWPGAAGAGLARAAAAEVTGGRVAERAPSRGELVCPSAWAPWPEPGWQEPTWPEPPQPG